MQAAESQCAGFWKRALAIGIDGLVFGGGSVGLAFALGPPAAAVLGIAGYLAYCSALEGSRLRATPGKMVVGLCVVDLDGERAGWLRAAARNCLKLVSAGSLFAGFLVAAFTPNKQAVHDLMASTLVVVRQRVQP